MSNSTSSDSHVDIENPISDYDVPSPSADNYDDIQVDMGMSQEDQKEELEVKDGVDEDNSDSEVDEDPLDPMSL